MNKNWQASCIGSDRTSYFMCRAQISFKKWGKAAAEQEPEDLMQGPWQWRERNRACEDLDLRAGKEQQKLSWTCKEAKLQGQQQVHNRDCHEASFALLQTYTGWLQQMVNTGTQVNTEFLEKWEEEEGWGEATVTFFKTYWNPKSSSEKVGLVTRERRWLLQSAC